MAGERVQRAPRLSLRRAYLFENEKEKKEEEWRRATEKRGREQPGVSWRFITATLYAARRRARVAFKKKKKRERKK